ncbi:hypothetical protein [Nocardioides sp. AE5]|nr:hypothetical protein [Nocardioides sp. AE5]MDT0201046.1 hypothetical protein [Nocardioides sp. AE5]
MSLNALVLSAAENSGDGSIPPIVVGGVALGILLFALLVVVAIGGGREHS